MDVDAPTGATGRPALPGFPRSATGGGPASTALGWHHGVMTSINGFHHVRIPVSDLDVSTDWYVSVLGFELDLYVEEEDGPIGALLHHPAGAVLGLHLDASMATALQGFSVVGLAVGGTTGLEEWSRRLDEIGSTHGTVTKGHLGWFLEVTDPDGIVVQLHTAEQPDAEEV